MNGWTLSFAGYDAGDEGRREALCTLGNGYFATRGAWPGSIADGTHYPGAYLAGCYNRLRDEIDGHELENESLVNLPDWLPMRVAIDDGDWLSPETADVVDLHQELDLRRGVLTRRFRLRDLQGRTVAGVERRFVHMADPHLAAQELTVTGSGHLRIRAGINGSVTNSGVERYRRLSGRHLCGIESESYDDGTLLVTARTSQSGIGIAVAARVTVDPDVTLESVREPDAIYHEFTAAGQVTVRKTVAIFSSRDPAISEPGAAAIAAVREAPDFDSLLERHTLAWDHLWRHFDIQLDADGTDALAVLRLNMFHLLQSVSPHSRNTDAGVPARGLHGEAYRGHIFWDEQFVFPVLTLRMPELTKALLHYRYRRLPAARKAARAAGYPGAMYPWQSGSDGREESQRYHLNPMSGRWTPDATHLQRHVGLAIAYTMWQYVEATGDNDFLADHGAEVLAEIARFFAGLATYDRGRDRYVIRGVVGPDEFHTGYPGAKEPGIDNNAYTNVMAVWLLQRAVEALERLPGWRRTELSEAIGLRPEELIEWDRISRRMFIPFHDGVVSQFEGYADLTELDWPAYRERYGDISRLDRILEAEGLSVNAYQASKQADVLMLLYLLPRDELRALFGRLGYRLTDATVERTIDYYLARTSHGSTLSALVHAWGLATVRRDAALSFLMDVMHSDVSGPHGGTTAEGIHLAAMAGSIDLLQRCFTGLVIRGDVLSFDPRWPATLGTLRLVLRYRGHRLAVELSRTTLTVRSEPGPAHALGSARPIRIRCRRRTHTLAQGESVTFDHLLETTSVVELNPLEVGDHVGSDRRRL